MPLIQQEGELFVVHEAGLELLEGINRPVRVLAMAGNYRSGKSFLLNLLAHRRVGDLTKAGRRGARADSVEQSFGVGESTHACTRGIWVMLTTMGRLWSTESATDTRIFQSTENYAVEDSAPVLLLDTEGLSSIDQGK